jgi:hypothetical protein
MQHRVGTTRSRATLASFSLLAVLLSVSGCILGIEPGCRVDGGRPSEPWLGLILVADYPGAASVTLDRAGRSECRFQRTVWMLSPLARCERLPETDLRAIEEAWDRLVQAGNFRKPHPQPARPFLQVTNHDDLADCWRHFFIEPGPAARDRQVKEAAALTLQALTRTYGRRLERELEITELDGLLNVSE